MWKWLYGSNLAKKVDRLGTYAAALAYCFVLSVIPFLVIAFTLTTHLVGTVDAKAYQQTLSNVLPVEGDKAIMRMVTALDSSSPNRIAHSELVKIVGYILAIYTSFNLMIQIVKTLLFIFDDSRLAYEWSWKVLIKTLSLFVIWTFLLLTLTVCSVLSLDIHTSTFLERAWRVTSDLVMVFALFVAFFVTYYLVPSKRYRPREIRDGALIASFGWIGCSLVFTDVLPLIYNWKANLVYQALGSVVIILLWAQACAWSVITGACWVVRFSSRR